MIYKIELISFQRENIKLKIKLEKLNKYLNQVKKKSINFKKTIIK